MRYFAKLRDESFEVDRTEDGVRWDGTERRAELIEVGPGEFRLVLDGRSHRVLARPTDSGWHISLRGRSFPVEVEDERARALRELTARAGGRAGPVDVRAPMPGLIARVLVEPGQRVDRGDALAVVEAMKMENELRAEGSGIVASVAVSAGDVVNRDDLLVTLEAESPEAGGDPAGGSQSAEAQTSGTGGTLSAEAQTSEAGGGTSAGEAETSEAAGGTSAGDEATGGSQSAEAPATGTAGGPDEAERAG